MVVTKQIEGEREAIIHSKLYHNFENLFEDGVEYRDYSFGKIDFLRRLESGGIPDLVIRDKLGRPFLVIETKRIDRKTRIEKIDPFNTLVIKQAERYAMDLQAPYFATCNRDILVLFKTFQKFKPITQRNVKYYDLRSQDLKVVVKELLYDIIKFELGEAKWYPQEEVLIGRLRTLHELISPLIENSLIDSLKNKHFEKEYIDWLENQGFGPSEERNKITAKQTAYLLMNKILFYKTIESQYNLPVLRGINRENIREGLEEYFNKVVNDIDFEAVYEGGEFFDKIPLPIQVTKIINEFIEELKHYNLAGIKSEILGMVYKNLIPIYEKKRFGQYYTSAEVCDLITKLCIKKDNDVVFDPSCGCGSFLIKTYHLLKELKEKGSKKNVNQIHNEIIKQIYGVDINQFPTHLSVMNLAMQNIKATNDIINIHVADFFKTHLNGFDTQKAKGLDSKSSEIRIPKVNAIIGNPPYIRQEIIKNKELVRLVALSGLDLKNKKEISEKSDIYVYFFTHATSFLKNKGRFGFITSNSWLDVNYGEGLQKIFLDKYKIISIIALDINAFEDALANTCIIILEKEKDKLKREKNEVKFIRVKKQINVKKLVSIIESKTKDFEDDKLKQISIKQKRLHNENKWGIYHKAPLIYFKLRENSKLTILSEKLANGETGLASISYPYKTSANDFFVLRKESVKQWGIEDKYLHPVLTTPKTIKKIKPTQKDTKNVLLVVNESKNALKQKKAGVLKYLEYGEKKRILLRRGSVAGEEVIGYQNIPSFKNKKIWYSFEEKNPAPILFPALIWDKYNVIWNKNKFYATHNFYQIDPTSKKDTLLILAYLNSTLNAFFMELYGRIPGGRSLSLMVYEVEQLPIINFKRLNERERGRIEKAFMNLIKIQDKNKDDLNAKRKLDKIFFDILKLSERGREEVYNGLKELKEIRMGGLIKVPKKEKFRFTTIKKGRTKKVQLTSLHKWLNT